MVALGAVVVEEGLGRRYFATLKPIADRFVSEALAVTGYSREQTLAFAEPQAVMAEFLAWLASVGDGRLVFVSDNNGFDWQFVNWYLHHYCGANPFGRSSMNLGSLYKGLVRDVGQTFKHLRRTMHGHNPLNDALGNAEAMLQMVALGMRL